MPPKKSQSGKKGDEKVKKVVEDKTFGLKNKAKSSKVQKYVEEVRKQATESVIRKQNLRETDQGPSKKQLAAEREAELAEIFKPVQVQKVPFGTDPKTVLCIFFKSGECAKGKKCKFSHDLEVGLKATKIDLYTDKRTIDDEKTLDNMDTWDRNKLDSVILSKHSIPRTQTDIVCKFFLEAIEESKYGWFWVCPNGGDNCKYKHALPPGYVLRPKKTLEDFREDENAQISLEEFLEIERHKLIGKTTPVTAETFAEWKKRRTEASEKISNEKSRAKENAARSGRRAGLSGRELFTFNPDLLDDADEDQNEDAGNNGVDLSFYIMEQSRKDLEAEQEAFSHASKEQNRLYNAQSIQDSEIFDEKLFAEEMGSLIV